MSASITLNHSISKTRKGTVKLELSCVAVGISPKVFAIEVYPKSADARAPQVRFSHVCSPMELNEFPEDEPGENCYFRVDNISMILDDDRMIEHIMSNMRSDISKLVKEYNELEDAEPETGSFTV